MKKMTLSLILIFLAVSLFSQTKRIELSKEKIGNFNCSYFKSIDLEKGDTLYYVFLGFQNMKYQSITDIKSLFFTTQEQISQFVKDLTQALPEMENKGSQMDWKRDLYTLHKYDFSKNLYVEEKKGLGYTVISKKQIEDLIKWFGTFQIGYDAIAK